MLDVKGSFLKGLVHSAILATTIRSLSDFSV